jgi:hypothetical protein
MTFYSALLKKHKHGGVIAINRLFMSKKQQRQKLKFTIILIQPFQTSQYL